MRGAQVALLGALAWNVPDLQGLLSEHLRDNHGELLPHLLMADYERWAEEALRVGNPRLQAFLSALESAYVMGGDSVEELISVSFLEHLPRPGEPGSKLRGLLGPSLREQLRVIG